MYLHFWYQHKFVFWYTRRTPGVRTQTSYEDNIKKIVDFSTVSISILYLNVMRSLYTLGCSLKRHIIYLMHPYYIWTGLRSKRFGSVIATWLAPPHCQAQLICIYSRMAFVHCGRYVLLLILFSNGNIHLSWMISFLFIRILPTAMVENGLLDLRRSYRGVFGRIWYGH